jgi:hypothetical protein
LEVADFLFDGEDDGLTGEALAGEQAEVVAVAELLKLLERVIRCAHVVFFRFISNV